MEVDIIGLAETNISWMPKDISITRIKVKEAFNRKGKIQTSASKEPVAPDYQPGGKLTVVGRRHIGRILEANKDKEGLGRWSWVKLEGKKINLYVITAYRVQQKSSNEISTAYTHQRKLLQKEE
eukprot:14798209-Ditylum_brightwellii.AAC.1